MNILIVEDEPTSLKLAHVILAAEGHKVNDTETAEKAIEQIKNEKPDIIVLDLSLPGMNGLDLTRKLRRDPATENIAIIAVTFYPSRFSRAEALAAGCDAYITKPIGARQLAKQIAEVASERTRNKLE